MLRGEKAGSRTSACEGGACCSLKGGGKNEKLLYVQEEAPKVVAMPAGEYAVAK